MANERSPNRDKARALWEESGRTRPLKDIAVEIGVSESLVRKWKCQDKWDGNANSNVTGKKHGNITHEKKSDVTPKNRKQGGQPGNSNAKGHGAPKGNKNNFKHGLYAKIMWSTLSEDERQLIESMELDDSIAMLNNEILLATAREHRFMKQIAEAKGLKSGLMVQGAISRKVSTGMELNIPNRPDNGINKEILLDYANEPRISREIKETTTKTIATFEVIQKWENELTRIQGRKARLIEAREKIRIEREKMNLLLGIGSEDDGPMVDPFVEALEGNEEAWDESEE